jgi:thiamine-phosphate pyrophosphorylase
MWKPNPTFEKDVYVISSDPEVLIQAVKDGSRIIQLRNKTASASEIREAAHRILMFRKETRELYPFQFILNDDPQLAVEIQADGVHIGQTDLPVVTVRKIIGPTRILGKTTHNLEQGLEAHREAVDYISVGPVFQTPTKPGRKPVGLDYVKQAAARYSLPFVSIGGINLANLSTLLEAGAQTIGIVRAASDVPAMLKLIKGN